MDTQRTFFEIVAKIKNTLIIQRILGIQRAEISKYYAARVRPIFYILISCWQ